MTNNNNYSMSAAASSTGHTRVTPLGNLRVTVLIRVVCYVYPSRSVLWRRYRYEGTLSYSQTSVMPHIRVDFCNGRSQRFVPVPAAKLAHVISAIWALQILHILTFGLIGLDYARSSGRRSSVTTKIFHLERRPKYVSYYSSVR